MAFERRCVFMECRYIQPTDALLHTKLHTIPGKWCGASLAFGLSTKADRRPSPENTCAARCGVSRGVAIIGSPGTRAMPGKYINSADSARRETVPVRSRRLLMTPANLFARTSQGISRVAAVALLAVTASGAHAAVSQITLGTHYQATSNTTSSNPPNAGACNSQSYCYWVFPRVPTGKQLVVTQVSCSISVSAAEPTHMYLGARLNNGTAVERFSFLLPSIFPSNQPGSILAVNETVYQLYASGQRPEVYMQLTGFASSTGSCSISGQMTDAAP